MVMRHAAATPAIDTTYRRRLTPEKRTKAANTVASSTQA